MIVSTSSLVINSRKYGDSSKLVTLFTREFGRLTVIAKGARNRKSTFGSSLETMNLVTSTIYKKPNRDLHTISKAEPDYNYKNLTSDFEKLSYGLMIMESLYQSLGNNIPFPELFDELTEILKSFDKPVSDSFMLFTKSQILIASYLGFSPEGRPPVGSVS